MLVYSGAASSSASIEQSNTKHSIILPRAKRARKSRANVGNTVRGSNTREFHRTQATVEYITLPPEPERSMLERKFWFHYNRRSEMIYSRCTDAWHVVSTIDPLVESDEENADEHVRTDYRKFINFKVHNAMKFF